MRGIMAVLIIKAMLIILARINIRALLLTFKESRTRSAAKRQ